MLKARGDAGRRPAGIYRQPNARRIEHGHGLRELRRRHQAQRGAGRVVRFQRARRARRLRIALAQRLAGHRLDLRPRQHARPQQHREGAAAIDDARLDADLARAAVEHVHAAAELGLDMRRRGRADAAEAVRAGCRQAPHAQRFALLQQRLRHQVRRATQANGRVSAGCRRRHAHSARHDHRQRAGPQAGHQPFGQRRDRRREAPRRRSVGHVHDQRVVGRPAFGFEDFGHRRIVVRARAQAIHRFGGKRDQFAGRQRRSSLLDHVGPRGVQQHVWRRLRTPAGQALHRPARPRCAPAAAWPL